MDTKYNIGDCVTLKAIVSEIHVTNKNTGPKYVLSIMDGEAGWGNAVSITERMLVAMSKDTEKWKIGEEK